VRGEDCGERAVDQYVGVALAEGGKVQPDLDDLFQEVACAGLAVTDELTALQDVQQGPFVEADQVVHIRQMPYEAYQLEDDEELFGGEAVQVVHDDEDRVTRFAQGFLGFVFGGGCARVAADAVADLLDQPLGVQAEESGDLPQRTDGLAESADLLPCLGPPLVLREGFADLAEQCQRE
jgi:hypothetical protein